MIKLTLKEPEHFVDLAIVLSLISYALLSCYMRQSSDELLSLVILLCVVRVVLVLLYADSEELDAEDSEDCFAEPKQVKFFDESAFKDLDTDIED